MVFLHQIQILPFMAIFLQPTQQLLMIEQIEDETLSDIHANSSRVKPLFNPYQAYRPQPSPNLSASTPSSVLLPEETQECRICLQTGDSPGNRLLSPCSCTGTVRFIHDKCMRQWVLSLFRKRTREEQMVLMEQGVECDLCKAKIGLSFRTDYACCQSQPFCRKFKENPVIFVLFVTVLLIVTGTEAFLGKALGSGEVNFDNQPFMAAIFLTAALFLAVTAVMVVHTCARDYLIERQWILEGYRKTRPAGRLRHMPIVPVDLE